MYMLLLLNARSPRVLHALTPPLLARGYTVMRYNSRGVGRSTGRASLVGCEREMWDLREVVGWALKGRAGVERGVEGDRVRELVIIVS